MIDPAIVPVLEALFEAELNSFVRYIVQVSQPPIVKGADEKALGLIQDLARVSDRGLEALRRFLDEADMPVDDDHHWPLRYTSFNYLRPAFLLGPLVQETERHVRELRQWAGELEATAWVEAREAVEALIDRYEEQLGRLRALETQRPWGDADAPVIKGTSASRW